MGEQRIYEQGKFLPLPRCPHCGIARPNLEMKQATTTKAHDIEDIQIWHFYGCNSCGMIVSAVAYQYRNNSVTPIIEFFPSLPSVDENVPGRARNFLVQAKESLHSPAGAVMLAASAVDAMLKEKGLKEGSLYERIESAVERHLITVEMGKWAHDVRLDANDQRHADTDAELPSTEDAERVVDFAGALAELLFVLPARVSRGLSGEITEGSGRSEDSEG